MSAAPKTSADALGQLLELVGSLTCEVRELRAEIADGREASPWMTTEEAAVYLKVSRDTLDKYALEHGHEDGGPVNVGQRRKVLRWNRATLDAWFRRVAGIAAPKPMRRRSPVKAEEPLERFDWSTV